MDEESPTFPAVAVPDGSAVGGNRVPANRARLRALGRLALPIAALAGIAGAVLLLSRPWQNDAVDPPGMAAVREAERLGALDPLQPKQGQPAPDFALRSLAGPVLRLSDFRGSVVLINFWATWCGPCRAEMAEIEAVYQAQKDRAFVVLAVNDDNASTVDALRLARDFREEVGVSFPMVLDAPAGDVFTQYRLYGLPSSFLVDADGIVRFIKFGPLNRDELTREVERARRPRS